MPWTTAILTWIAGAVGTIAVTVIHALTSRYLVRALAVTAMATAFFLAFQIMYAAVKDALDIAITHTQGASTALGISMEFGLCLVPSTLPEAMTVILTVAIQAMAVRWTRMVLFAKLA